MNDYEELKDKLNSAFKAMRKEGLIARQAFGCCCSCAAGEIAAYAKEQHAKGKHFNGTCYYTQQDRTRLELGNDFYLSFGKIYMDEFGETSMATATVGELVCIILAEHGVEHKWEGNDNVCIRLKGWKTIEEEREAREEAEREAARVAELKSLYRRGSSEYALRLLEMLTSAVKGTFEHTDRYRDVTESIEQAIIDLKGEAWLDENLFKE